VNDPLSAPRSFTDPLSNLVVLPSVDIRRHINEICNKDLPLEFLPSFIHEATHHWCFTSPVGVTMLLLFFRARRHAMKFLADRGHSHRDVGWDALDAVVRYEFAQELMRPLSEGIALFAEHDASVGHTEIISGPMKFGGALFAQGVAVRSGKPWENLPLVLAGSRLSRQHIRRKADLLMQPFSCSHGGYLPGYLNVKNIWLILTLHHKTFYFHDSDFFLQYLRSVFYDDWSLVDCLLDDESYDVGALGPIVDRLQVRMNDLVADASFSNTEAAHKFEVENLESRRPKLEIRSDLAQVSIYYDQIGSATAEDERGRRRLTALFHELFDRWPDDDSQRLAIELDLETLRLWNTITLGHATLPARINASRLEFLDENGDPSFSSPVPSSMTSGWSGELGIDIVASIDPIGLFGFITRDTELITTWQLSNSELPGHLNTPMVRSRHRSALMDLSRSLVKRSLEDESFDITRAHARRELERLNAGIYLQRAIPGVDDEEFASVCQIMRDDGILPLLDNNLDLLADAAAASLCIPLHHKLESVTPFHQWSRSDPYEAVRAIDASLNKRLGVSPFPLLDTLIWVCGI
jgi:hypothetical protein